MPPCSRRDHHAPEGLPIFGRRCGIPAGKTWRTCDPVDTALLFLLIGVGMACGLEHHAIAAGGTAFPCIISCVLDLGAPGQLEIDPPNAAADEALFQALVGAPLGNSTPMSPGGIPTALH